LSMRLVSPMVRNPVVHSPVVVQAPATPLALALAAPFNPTPLRTSMLRCTETADSAAAPLLPPETRCALRLPLVLRSIAHQCSRFMRVMCTLLFTLMIVVPLPTLPALAAVDPSTTPSGAMHAAVRVPDGVPGLGGLTLPSGPVRRQKTSFVTAAVESVGPAVVRIDTERLVDRQPLEGYLFPGLEPDSQRRESGQGSGVILSEEGLILTNAHVVKNAAKVTVTLTDGRIFEGLVKGQDDYMDLAAVKIKPTGRKLPTAPLGRSDDLQVGDWVIAIGNAVGLDSTVTLGIVSSLSRSAAEVGIPNKKVNFIQTDAAINPGNSGGPLLNEFGEVIGINTAIRANAAGIGFAIPINTAEKAMRELSQGRKIAHAYLGISMSTLTADSAKQNNADPNSNVELPEMPGALVLAVAPETPAAKAGFKKFDLIQELDGKPVKSAADAQLIVDASKVGQAVVAKIVRGQKTLSLTVITGDLSDRPSPTRG